MICPPSRLSRKLPITQCMDKRSTRQDSFHRSDSMSFKNRYLSKDASYQMSPTSRSRPDSAVAVNELDEGWPTASKLVNLFSSSCWQSQELLPPENPKRIDSSLIIAASHVPCTVESLLSCLSWFERTAGVGGTAMLCGLFTTYLVQFSEDSVVCIECYEVCPGILRLRNRIQIV